MNKTRINRYTHSSSVSNLIPILKERIEENRSIARSWDWKVCPWWCNERASVSALAAAVWKAGGKALEEFCDEKIYRRSKYQGRCDLYFEFRGHEFIAETKHIWLAAGRRSHPPTSVLKKAQGEAWKDVHYVTETGTKLSIVFAVPYFPESDRAHVNRLLKEWQAQLFEISCHSLAWVFPAQTRHLQWKNDSHYYPGVAAILHKA